MSSKVITESIYQSCLIKYPNMVPIELEPQEGIIVKKKKFLVSEKMSGLELQRTIIKHVEKQAQQSLYFFVVDHKKHRMLQKNVPISDVFSLYKTQQGYLHIRIMKQNVF